MVELVQAEVEDEGLRDAELQEEVDLDDLDGLLCYDLFGGASCIDEMQD